MLLQRRQISEVYHPQVIMLGAVAALLLLSHNYLNHSLSSTGDNVGGTATVIAQLS